MNRKERRRLEKAARQTGDTGSARPPAGGGRASSAGAATSGASGGGAGADIPAILRRAFTFHAAGRTREALGLYRRILAAQPNHADALSHAGAAGGPGAAGGRFLSRGPWAGPAGDQDAAGLACFGVLVYPLAGAAPSRVAGWWLCPGEETWKRASAGTASAG